MGEVNILKMALVIIQIFDLIFTIFLDSNIFVEVS